jgi:hypothetical protein
MVYLILWGTPFIDSSIVKKAKKALTNAGLQLVEYEIPNIYIWKRVDAHRGRNDLCVSPFL